jgi:hypothetical protein
VEGFVFTDMPTNKIFKQIGNEVIELTGQDLEQFLQYRADVAILAEAELTALEQLKNNKISAYTKLGLTQEEIDAII